MQNFNKLNSLFFLFLSFFGTNFSYAGTLYEFEFTPLVMVEENNRFYGSFDFIHPINPFSCSFLFFSSFEKKFPKKIKGFSTYGTYAERDQEYDSNGHLFLLENGELLIQFDRVPDPGCLNLGERFTEGPEDRYVHSFRPMRKKNVIGIRMVGIKKSFFYEKNGENFRSKKTYLIASDVVIALKEIADFQLIQYRNPKSDKTIYGWLKKNHLINPFPKDFSNN